MKCPICDHMVIKPHQLAHPCFRHQDFKKIGNENLINQCQNCYSIFNDEEQHRKYQIDQIYKNRDYADQKKTDHMVFTGDGDKPVTTYFLQAKLLADILGDIKTPHILDIGCFDGKLLLSLDELFESGKMNGFDVNGHIKTIFPERENFKFWHGDFSKVLGKYDLICLSHSLQYIWDVKLFMKEVDRLLKKDGVIFIQVPDLSKNAYAILYGDLYYYYTPNILKNIFGHFGFEITVLDDNKKLFPRDLLVKARRARENNPSVHYIKDNTIDEAKNYIHQVLEMLKSFKSTEDIYVLGTTLNASFINSVLEEKVKCFVDENPKKIGERFHGKEIISPELLSGGETVLVPYGKTGSSLCVKLKSKYKGNFIGL